MQPYRLFRSEDWNGFWALLADNLANLVIAAGICKGVLAMPDSIVFGKILPGLGVALLSGLGFYAWQAVKLAQKEGRDDVTALPYGISTPVLFVYLFGILAPIYFGLKDADPETAALTAWQAGIAAAFVGGVVEALGSVLGPTLKRVTPRAGMLGTLAGIALVYIAAVPLASIFENPMVGFPALTIVLAGLIAGMRLPLGLPAGLMAIALGTAIGLFNGTAEVTSWQPSLHIPVPVLGDLFAGFSILGQHPEILAVVLPIEIYNFIETMNNVESAEAAGDAYDVRTCQLADGAGTMLGAIFGSAFPTTVYIGHPAYKKLGSRAGYALGVGLVIFVVAITGFHAFLYKLIPTAAVDPLLVFVGIVIVGQAFTHSPARHAVAVAIALIPHIGNLLVTKMGVAFQVTGQQVTPELIESLHGQSVHWLGHSALAQGAIVSGLLWGAIVAFLIDGHTRQSAGFCLGAALLTLIGILHAPHVGYNPSPIAGGYLIMALLLIGFDLSGARPGEAHFDEWKEDEIGATFTTDDATSPAETPDPT
ncbi:MAG: xanthine/uracil/vitamin C permease [Vulcanimicrobiota bacterium]